MLETTTTDGTVTVTVDGTTIARYNAVTAASKPHFDTVALPPSAGETAGRNLVLAAPHDHAWHLGLFFCQKLVDGINCWESERNEAAGRPYGAAEHVEFDVSADESPIELAQTVEWRKDTGDHLLTDDRTIRIHDPDDEGYLLTWDQRLRAVEGRRYLSSETIHGHYSGFSARFARSLTDGQIRVADGGGTTDDSDERVGAWCDYTGRLDGKPGMGEPWSAGITLLDHPDNRDHPTHWFTMNEPFGFIAANPTWKTVVTLPEDETITWRWGAWIHHGSPTPDRIDEVYERFVERAGDGGGSPE